MSATRNDNKLSPDGSTLTRLRHEKVLSREALSEGSGISLKTLRNLETNDDYRCKPKTIEQLSIFYGIEPGALVKQAATTPALTLLTSSDEIIAANIHIAASARKILVCAGSRARDPKYFNTIETTLRTHSSVVHFRVMAWPPFKQSFQDHLLELLQIRNPIDRSHGYKTIHIGLYSEHLKFAEHAICANEKSALIVLPSMFGLGEYNTALLIEGTQAVEKYTSIVKSLYQICQPLETAEKIKAIGLVQNGDYYE